MEIRKAEYEISNVDVKKCPDTSVPEYAFIGRSNVGKSSLINMLTKRNGLAKTSQTPGKTLLINHFRINDGQWYIVDLPGYGYAARGKKQREEIDRLIKSYIEGRSQMTCLFVLIDVRHEPQKIDVEFIHWLGENGVPFAIIFTKADKLSKTAAERNVAMYKRTLLKSWEELPPFFVTSSSTKQGREDLLEFIGSINKKLKEDNSQGDEESDSDHPLPD